jgi:glycerophosphoryl diester phosphodiesterase
MNRNLFACCGLIAMTAIAAIAAAADATSPAVRLLETKRPLVIAHRGYSQFAPENTLPSFQLAKAAGADMVELDYYHSKDGELVVMHDATLDRTTDAVAKWGGSKIRLDSKTLAELKTLDAGKWFKPEFTGTKIPTLAESLDLIQDGNMTLVERKAGDAATCVKMLQARGLVNKLVVQAFDWSYLADFHALEPKQVLGALGPPATKEGKKLTEAEKLLTKEWIDLALKSGVQVVGWNNQVTKEAVDYAHSKGLKVWVYTINDQAEANRLLDLRVDGLITNNTSLMWRSIAERQTKVLP